MEILNLARELGAAIQKDEAYITYKIKEQNAECDENLKKITESFNSKKEEINLEISKENSNQEKIDSLNSEISSLYTEIMNNPLMKEYNEAKLNFQQKLQKVSLIINSAAVGQDPYTVNTEAGSECTGGCQSCGGCS